MAARALGNLGLTAFWPLASNGWKDQMDRNLLRLSYLAQPVVLSIEATAPGGASVGDIHIASGSWGGGAANDIIIRDIDTDDVTEIWVPITPEEGWEVYNADTGKKLRFDGSDWVDPTVSVPTIITDSTTNRNISDADLDGNSILFMTNAADVTVTLPDTLSALGPLTVWYEGDGTLQIVVSGSVTLQSPNSYTYVTTKHGAITIVPRGADVYKLMGAEADPA